MYGGAFTDSDRCAGNLPSRSLREMAQFQSKEMPIFSAMGFERFMLRGEKYTNLPHRHRQTQTDDGHAAGRNRHTGIHAGGIAMYVCVPHARGGEVFHGVAHVRPNGHRGSRHAQEHLRRTR